MYWSQVRVLAGPPNPVKSKLRNLNFLNLIKRPKVLIPFLGLVFREIF